MSLRIGIIGYGSFGKLLSELFLENDDVDVVRVANKLDENYDPEQLVLNSSKNNNHRQYEFYDLKDLMSFGCGLDVIVLAVSIPSLEVVLQNCPIEIFSDKLVVDVCSVKIYPRDVMLRLLPSNSDILCTHPMFGPRSVTQGLAGKNFMYEHVRIANTSRCQRYLSIWESFRCNLIEMSCQSHDEITAKSQFIAHFIARSLASFGLEKTPIDTPSFSNLCAFSSDLCDDSWELFQALYSHNTFAAKELEKLKDSIAKLECDLSHDTALK